MNPYNTIDPTYPVRTAIFRILRLLLTVLYKALVTSTETTNTPLNDF
jgi:hypothetical protein